MTRATLGARTTALVFSFCLGEPSRGTASPLEVSDAPGTHDDARRVTDPFGRRLRVYLPTVQSGHNLTELPSDRPGP